MPFTFLKIFCSTKINFVRFSKNIRFQSFRSMFKKMIDSIWEIKMNCFAYHYFFFTKRQNMCYEKMKKIDGNKCFFLCLALNNYTRYFSGFSTRSIYFIICTDLNTTTPIMRGLIKVAYPSSRVRDEFSMV